jgi:hypothetical protein
MLSVRARAQARSRMGSSGLRQQTRPNVRSRRATKLTSKASLFTSDRNTPHPSGPRRPPHPIRHRPHRVAADSATSVRTTGAPHDTTGPTTQTRRATALIPRTTTASVSGIRREGTTRTTADTRTTGQFGRAIACGRYRRLRETVYGTCPRHVTVCETHRPRATA